MTTEPDRPEGRPPQDPAERIKCSALAVALLLAKNFSR